MASQYNSNISRSSSLKGSFSGVENLEEDIYNPFSGKVLTDLEKQELLRNNAAGNEEYQESENSTEQENYKEKESGGFASHIFNSAVKAATSTVGRSDIADAKMSGFNNKISKGAGRTYDSQSNNNKAVTNSQNNSYPRFTAISDPKIIKEFLKVSGEKKHYIDKLNSSLLNEFDLKVDNKVRKIEHPTDIFLKIQEEVTKSGDEDRLNDFNVALENERNKNPAFFDKYIKDQIGKPPSSYMTGQIISPKKQGMFNKIFGKGNKNKKESKEEDQEFENESSQESIQEDAVDYKNVDFKNMDGMQDVLSCLEKEEVNVNDTDNKTNIGAVENYNNKDNVSQRI